MDPFVPGGGLGAAAARSAVTSTRHALLEKLRMGEWTYPETKWGDANLSGVFDVVFVFLILATWAYATLTKNGVNNMPKPDTIQAIKDFCIKGNFNGGQNSWLWKYVGFFTMEEVTNWLSVSLVCTLIVLKILCGAKNVNAGYVIYVLIVGVVARHMRLGINGQVWKQVPPALMIVSLFTALWAYTDAFGVRVDDNSEKHGQNIMFLFAGLIFIVAAIVKTYISTGNMANIEGTELENKAQMLYQGEFAFYLTGLSTVVVGSSIATFVFSEAVFVAYAATEFYAAPFYVLYAIPFYFLITGLMAGCGGGRMSKIDGKSTFFNMFLVFLGTTVLVLAQGQVCSLPGPDGRHIGEKVCGALNTIGFKSLEHDASELEMKPLALTFLGIFSVLAHVMVYLGARFSRHGLMRTIGEVCAKAENNVYSKM